MNALVCVTWRIISFALVLIQVIPVTHFLLFTAVHLFFFFFLVLIPVLFYHLSPSLLFFTSLVIRSLFFLFQHGHFVLM